MDEIIEGEQAKPPGIATRAGQSGEGSRSALELLIQQEEKRNAQLPREAGAAAPGGPAP